YEADGGDEQGVDRQRGDDAHPQAQIGPAAAALLLQSSPGWARCTVLSSVGEWFHGCSGRIRHPGVFGLSRRCQARSRPVPARAATDDRALLFRTSIGSEVFSCTGARSAHDSGFLLSADVDAGGVDDLTGPRVEELRRGIANEAELHG